MGIKRAKISLYIQLLDKGMDMTDNEVDIMFLLAQDKDIQYALERRVQREQTILSRSRSPHI